MQTITFTANTGSELRQQMLDFLGILPESETGLMREDLIIQAERAKRVADAADAPIPAKSAAVKTKDKKLAGIKQPVIPGQAPGKPEPQGSGALKEDLIVPGPGTTSAAEPPSVPSPLTFDEQIVVTPPKEALELKEKVIDALQAAFRAGKVQKVRSVLTQYGNGAKSFREIDIGAFPEIDKALQHGALN